LLATHNDLPPHAFSIKINDREDRLSKRVVYEKVERGSRKKGYKIRVVESAPKKGSSDSRRVKGARVPYRLKKDRSCVRVQANKEWNGPSARNDEQGLGQISFEGLLVKGVVNA
jgi:hypothetical protein